MYNELNQLVLQAKEGDIDAKEEILDRLQGLIFNSIQRYYNNREEYEDLIQEGNMIILECINSYDDSRGVYFLGYIKAMLKYAYLNKHKRKYHLSLNAAVGREGGGELMDLLESENDSPLDKIIELEEQSRIRQALSKLTDRQREVIISFYYKEMSISEIAKILSITYRTVVNTKTRALEIMRELI